MSRVEFPGQGRLPQRAFLKNALVIFAEPCVFPCGDDGGPGEPDKADGQPGNSKDDKSFVAHESGTGDLQVDVGEGERDSATFSERQDGMS